MGLFVFIFAATIIVVSVGFVRDYAKSPENTVGSGNPETRKDIAFSAAANALLATLWVCSAIYELGEDPAKLDFYISASFAGFFAIPSLIYLRRFVRSP